MRSPTPAQAPSASAFARFTLGGDATANDASTPAAPSIPAPDGARPQLSLRHAPARGQGEAAQPPQPLSLSEAPSVGFFKSIPMLLARLFQQGVDFQGWAPPTGYLDDALGLVREHLDFVLIGQPPGGQERLAAVNAALWGASAAGPVTFWTMMKGEGREEAIASDLRQHRHGKNMTEALEKAVGIELPQLGDDPYGRFRFLMDQPGITPKPLFLSPFTNYGVETLVHDDAAFGVASIPYYNAALRLARPNHVEMPYLPDTSMPLPERMHLDASLFEKQQRMFDVFEQLLRRRRTALVLPFGLQDVQRMQTMAEYHQKLGRPVVGVPIANGQHVAMVVGTPACAPLWRQLEAHHRSEVVFWEPAPARAAPAAPGASAARVDAGSSDRDWMPAALLVLAQAGGALICLWRMHSGDRTDAARGDSQPGGPRGEAQQPRAPRGRKAVVPRPPVEDTRPPAEDTRPPQPAPAAASTRATALSRQLLQTGRERPMEFKEIARRIAQEIPLAPHEQTRKSLRGDIHDQLQELLDAGHAHAADAAAIYCAVVDLAVQEAPRQLGRWMHALGVKFATVRQAVEEAMAACRDGEHADADRRRLEKSLEMLKAKVYLALDAETYEDPKGRGWLGPAQRARTAEAKAATTPVVVVHARAVNAVAWTNAEIYQRAKQMAAPRSEGAAPLALLRNDEEVFIPPRPEDRPHLHVKKDMLVFKKPDGSHYELVMGDRSHASHIQAARGHLRPGHPPHAGMLDFLDFLEGGGPGPAA